MSQGVPKIARKPAPSRTATTPGLPARRLALAQIDRVLRRHQPLEEVEAGDGDLAPRDRAFARLLVATVLRRLGQLDELIAAALPRGVPRGRAPVGDLLRLGLAQVMFLDTALHAAVSTTLALAEETGGARIKGLLDASLRRLAREKATRLDGQDAARLNTPDWLWQRWTAAYGAATARAIAEAHLQDPPLDLTLAGDAAGWADRLEAVSLPTGTLRRASAAVDRLPGFDEGAWWVQDAAAALPARLLHAAPGETVIDLCAAPGGKTAQLAAAGAHVLALDRSAERLARLQANLARLNLAATPVVGDAAVWRPEQPVEAVLVDAPCSATGTMRRHPDVARLKRPQDPAALAQIQRAILANAVTMLAPGGRLVWCTCSLEPEEGEAISAWLADADPAVVPDPIDGAEIAGLDGLVTPQGWVRTLPCHWPEQGGLDGFHIARFRKIA